MWCLVNAVDVEHSSRQDSREGIIIVQCECQGEAETGSGEMRVGCAVEKRGLGHGESIMTE